MRKRLTDSRTYWRWLLMPLALFVLALPTAAQDATPPAPDDPPASIWDGTLRRIRTPILMYHYVSPLPVDADATRRDLTVSPEQFRAHLEYLFFEGYTPISLYDLHDALLTGSPLPAKPVVLTFDDGYSDHYRYVFPALGEYGFTATFFVVSGFADANLPAHLSWEQIREMADAGMSIEPHTKDHVELDGRSYDFIVYQTLGSLESIAYYTGRQPHMFSYPVGRYDDLVLDVLGQMSIWRAVTTQRGALHTTDNMLEVARIRVPGGASTAALASILRTP